MCCFEGKWGLDLCKGGPTVVREVLFVGGSLVLEIF